jgi:hypothetical protein
VSCADVLTAAVRIAGLHAPAQPVGLRPASGMFLETRQRLLVAADDLADQVRPSDGLLQLPRHAGGAGDERFDLELVRVHHQANQGLLIIRVTTDVGQHSQTRTLSSGE